MKKITSSAIILLLLALVCTSFSHKPAPKLYPKLEAYFKTAGQKPMAAEHQLALENLRAHINASNLEHTASNVVFYCSENSFRSQASQIFLQTLCYARKHRNVEVFSAGKTPTEVNPALIVFLESIGYRVSPKADPTHKAYEIYFSDNADPITIYSKSLQDSGIPATDVASVIVCDTNKEAECKDIPDLLSFKFALPFNRVNDVQLSSGAQDVLNQIASEMSYISEKSNK